MTQELICINCRKLKNPNSFYDIPYSSLIKEHQLECSRTEYLYKTKLYEIPSNPRIIHTSLVFFLENFDYLFLNL